MRIINHFMGNGECYWQLSRCSEEREIRLNVPPEEDDLVLLTRHWSTTARKGELFAAMRVSKTEGCIAFGQGGDVLHFPGLKVSQPVDFGPLEINEVRCETLEDLRVHSMEWTALEGSSETKEQGVGAYAERVLFPQWLNRAEFAYFRIDQDTAQLAERLRAPEVNGKRPDFMVYRPHHQGVFLVDVKCLRYDHGGDVDCWRLDRNEVQRHSHFGPSMCYALYDRSEVEAFTQWVLGRTVEALPTPEPRFVAWRQVDAVLRAAPSTDNYARFQRNDTHEQVYMLP